MLQYILESITFQLVFLLIYDLFLKRETFFQWNRLYLIATYSLSLILPWVKIEALKTTVPEQFQDYPEFLWGLNDAAITVTEVEESTFNMSWEEGVLYGGMLLATVLFVYKLYQIYALKQKGEVYYFKDFTQVVIANSAMAFSFFKSVFLGDKIVVKEHQNILDHELVHIRQKHSYDLLFFELMRIVAWFNPLVYVYQRKVSELHEFIADAQVAKTNKKEQYEFLLSEVFQTQNISFINQFFKSSLIKKRIVMLQKSKSKKILKLKYVLLVPIILGMLVYSSCEYEKDEPISNLEAVEATSQITVPFMEAEEVPIFPGCEDADDKRACFNEMIIKHIKKNFNYPLEAQESGIQGKVYVMFNIDEEGAIENVKMRGPNKLLEEEAARIISKLPKMQAGKQKGKAVKVPFSIPINFRLEGDSSSLEKQTNDLGLSFTLVDEVPVFPGCENAIDKRACFNKSINKHIKKHFNYPLEAQEQGIQGRVSVVFRISEEGAIENVRMRGPNKLLEEEVARIISKLPKMKPGKYEGKKVSVPFSIPVNFKLKANSTNKEQLQILSSMLNIVNSQKENGFLPTNIGLRDSKDIIGTIKKYNTLITERKRLLEKSNESNPVIKNLDEQLSSLKLNIRKKLEMKSSEIKQEIKNE